MATATLSPTRSPRRRQPDSAAAEKPAPVPAERPEFIAVPRPGTRCPLTSLTRSGMLDVLKTGKVRTVSLRAADASRGRRLVHLGSLLGYLNSLAEGGQP